MKLAFMTPLSHLKDLQHREFSGVTRGGGILAPILLGGQALGWLYFKNDHRGLLSTPPEKLGRRKGHRGPAELGLQVAGPGLP